MILALLHPLCFASELVQQKVGLELVALFTSRHEVNEPSAAKAAQPWEPLVVCLALVYVQRDEVIHGVSFVTAVPAEPASLGVHSLSHVMLHGMLLFSKPN